jgi:cyclomaltodextrinase / maltogenic alpha-amylase / neopullulanase
VTWSEHVIWWQLDPLTFLGAPAQAPPAGTAPQHRLGALEPWLDYLVELGCNGLALGPVFAAQSHGYDTVDHFAIDPRLGTDDDFDALVEACRRRGVRLLLDGVFNHVGRGFPAFQDVLRHGRESAHAGWFRLDFDAPPELAGSDGFGYADFEGHHGLVALNHDEPAVADHVAAVMDHWLRRGADGWRLDAAYAVPSAFWRAVLPRVRAAHPQAWFVGEVIHGDYPRFVAEGGLDSVTQYELWKAIWSSLNDRNFFELSWALTRHGDLTADFDPMTFVGNHDVTRIASRLDDERHLAHALVILFTVAGVPSVYAGDEQAFRGVKYDRVDGDAEIRPAFPDTPAALAPHGRSALRLHQDLTGLRRRHPWLLRARPKVVHLDNEVLAYQVGDLEVGDPADGLLVLLNVGEQPFTLAQAPGSLLHLLGSGVDDEPAGHVGPHGWAVLQLRG